MNIPMSSLTRRFLIVGLYRAISVIVLGATIFISKALAYELPEHLYVIPLPKPTSDYIVLSDIQDNIEIPDNFVITLQKEIPVNSECKEVHVVDANNKTNAFNVCVRNAE